MRSNGMKYGFWGVLLLLVVSNGYWFYSAVDSGITQTYQEMSYQDCERQAAQLETIANHFVSGKLLSEVQPFLISTAEPGSSFPKPADHLFIVGNLALKLDPNEKVQALVRDPYKP